jgi:penicillin-binding protein 2
MVRFRVRILMALVAVPLLAILGRLAMLQLWRDADTVRDLESAEDSRRRIVLLSPRRGSIFDRNGKVLAQDLTSFDIEFKLNDLHPRERYLPLVEKALGLEGCLALAASGGGEGKGEGPRCRGEVLEGLIANLLANLDPEALTPAEPSGSIADVVLVDRIGLDLYRDVRKAVGGGRGLKDLERLAGLYFFDSVEEGKYELRMKPRIALTLETVLYRVAEITGEPYAALRKRVADAEDAVYRESSGGEPPNATARAARRERLRLLVRGVDKRAVTEIEYRSELYPGIRIADGHRRDYPHGEPAAAITGYLLPASSPDVQAVLLKRELLIDAIPLDYEFLFEDRFEVLRRFGSRESDGRIGKHGIEEYYDSRLRGSYGVLVEEVGPRQVRRKDLHSIPPKRGEDVTTALDVDLQEVVYNSLADLCRPKGQALTGAAAIMDLTGRLAPEGAGPPGAILASVGFPDYRPDLMRDDVYLKELYNRKTEGILYNYDRPARFHQAPGSVFKLVVAAAAMENGTRRPESGPPVPSPLGPAETYNCPQFIKLGGEDLSCLGSHGEINLLRALGVSCNIYFYRMARERLQPGVLWWWARDLGFGRSPGIDLDDPEADPEANPDRPAGLLLEDTSQNGMCRYAIGSHAFVQASVLQVLRCTAGIALGGDRLPWPYLVTPRAPQPLHLKRATVEALREGMRRAVHEDRGTAADLNGYRVAVKTGTAEVKKGDPDALDPALLPINSAWIAGYAPVDRPEIAFVILLDRVPRLHGADCAPVVEDLLDFLDLREPGKYRIRPSSPDGSTDGIRKEEP